MENSETKKCIFAPAPEWLRTHGVIKVEKDRIKRHLLEPITDELLDKVNNERRKFLERLQEDNLIKVLTSTALSPVDWIFRKEIDNILFAYDTLIYTITSNQVTTVDVYEKYDNKFAINNAMEMWKLEREISDTFNQVIGIER